MMNIVLMSQGVIQSLLNRRTSLKTRKYLLLPCAALLAAAVADASSGPAISGEWIPLLSDSRSNVRAVIASEVGKVTGYSTIEEGVASHRALMEEKEREDSASKAFLSELENRFKHAKRVRDDISSRFSEKSGENKDSRKNLQEITTSIQNLDSKIGLCEKEIVTQQEHLKKYLRNEKQSEALAAVIHTQGMRDTLHGLNRRADELSAPELASYMGTTIQSYTEVIGGILSKDFIRSITEGTAKPVNEEPVSIQLDVSSQGTKYLRVKRYELYPFQESGEARKTSGEVVEKNNIVLIFTFSELEQLLSKNGYQIAKYDTSRIRKLIDEVKMVNRQQSEALKETIAAIQERIAYQQNKIAESRMEKERELAKKTQIEETTKRLDTELAAIKERKEKTEAELAVVQSQLNEKKRVSETIIPKFALQASKGGQSPADASIEAIIDKLEEVKNEARVQHTRETVEVTNNQLTSYEQTRSSTEARVTAVRLIALTNEGGNGVRVRVAFRVRMIISDNNQGYAEPPPSPAVSPPSSQPIEPEVEQKPVTKRAKGKKSDKTPAKIVGIKPASPRTQTGEVAVVASEDETGAAALNDKTTIENEQRVNEDDKKLPAAAVNLTPVKTLTQHTKDILSLAFSNDSARAASGDRDNNVIVWDTRTWTPMTTLKGHRNNVKALTFSDRGSFLASGSSDETVIIWDLSKKTARLTIKTGEEVNALAFNPANTLLAIGADSSDITIWNVNNGAKISTLKSGDDVTALAYSPNGKLLATSGKEKNVRLWDMSGKGTARVLEGHRDDVRALVFTKDGSQLVTGSDDKSIIVWNAATGAVQKKLEGHEDEVAALAVTSDGSRLISAESRRSNGIVIVWDLKSGKILKRFKTGHKIERFAMAPNGGSILIGSGKALMVYRLE